MCSVCFCAFDLSGNLLAFVCPFLFLFRSHSMLVLFVVGFVDDSDGGGGGGGSAPYACVWCDLSVHIRFEHCFEAHNNNKYLICCVLPYYYYYQTYLTR